ncbi:hypothetical protein GN277_00440 [Lachnospiraceae bacterium WCA-9-b2]|jgi:hypothetical protein|uniref:Uncharacterized protein n=1 Tax=Sporofaciens musculi TaxID=2681861 RepID=A0A7X3MCN6_9FIRM|nr:hypothetical protein [Sporofaciens musculi]MXP73966.1 hypothetical protein [Sporofaciens musculi]
MQPERENNSLRRIFSSSKETGKKPVTTLQEKGYLLAGLSFSRTAWLTQASAAD